MPVSVLTPSHLWLHGTEKKPWRYSKGSVLLGELTESEKRLHTSQLAGKPDLSKAFSCKCENRSVPETLRFLEEQDIGMTETATHVLDNSFAQQRRGFGARRFAHRTAKQLCFRREPTYEDLLVGLENSLEYDPVMPHQVIDMMGLPRGPSDLFCTDEAAEHYFIAMRPIDINDNGVKRSSILIASGNGPQLRTDEMKGPIPLNTTFIVALT